MKKPFKYENNWRFKSIESLEKVSYGDPKTAPTSLVESCMELVKKPVGKLNVEDLRLLLGQQIAPFFLVPLALEHLTENIFVSGDLYDGDLLHSVVRLDITFWRENKHLWHEVNNLIKDHRTEIAAHKINTSIFDNAFND